MSVAKVIEMIALSKKTGFRPFFYLILFGQRHNRIFTPHIQLIQYIHP